MHPILILSLFVFVGCADNSEVRRRTPTPPSTMTKQEALGWTYEQGYKRGLWEAANPAGFHPVNPQMYSGTRKGPAGLPPKRIRCDSDGTDITCYAF